MPKSSSTTLWDQLLAAPAQFDFFQAVRIMERHAREESDSRASEPVPVGTDGPLSREPVRFRAQPSLTFPSNEISAAKRADTDERTPAELEVTFLGLTGPQGALPQHYTSQLIERLHVRYKDPTLRNFLDLFNHRTTSLFFRAWEKYRFAWNFERHRRQADLQGERDLFSYLLSCLVGLGTAGHSERMRVPDDLILYYAGHFSHRPRCAVSLQRLVQDAFQLRAQVQQFRGSWLQLSVQQQSSMPSMQHRQGRNLALGTNTVVGSRVWDVQGQFRLRLGPVSYRQFQELMPNGPRLGAVIDLVRFYVGAELDFDLQVVLRKSDVPPLQLSRDAKNGPRLGWNTWLSSRPFQRDPEDAVFVARDLD